MTMKFGGHSTGARGIWEAEHYIDGVHVRAIIHDADKKVAHERAGHVYADLESGAARRAKGEMVPVVEPRVVMPYGPAGHGDHAEGVWYGAADIAGVSYSLTVPATNRAEAHAELSRMFSDLAAGHTSVLSAGIVERKAAATA